jgi:hypothetical protein
MQPEEMLELLKREPFQPFRLHLTNGRTIDIHHPEINRVTQMVFVRGILDPASLASDLGPTASSAVWMDWSSIDRVEFLSSPLAAT